MDDMEFWGTEDEGGPLSLSEEWGGDEPLAARLMVEEHQTQDVPAGVALLTRAASPYTETLWIFGYPNAKLITITVPPVRRLSQHGGTQPGVVRSLPVGWRDMASAETFRARFEQTVASYLKEGWVRQSASVWAGDPWDAVSVLDQDAGF